jgi:hypothetical protein
VEVAKEVQGKTSQHNRGQALYPREQIKMLVDVATLRDKCFILLMCSDGLRRETITDLRIRDITKVDKYGLYRINVYKKENPFQLKESSTDY